MALCIPDNQPIAPLCKEAVGECWTKRVPPALVADHIKQVIERQIETTGMTPGAARDSVLALLIENEYRYSLEDHLVVLSRMIEKGEVDLDIYAPQDTRIDELRMVHDGKWGEERDEVAEDILTPAIDQVVETGGLTRLMIAAQKGDLDEVMRLVEIECADTQIRCNSKMNAYQRARDMGWFEVSDYLQQFESTDELTEAV